MKIQNKTHKAIVKIIVTVGLMLGLCIGSIKCYKSVMDYDPTVHELQVCTKSKIQREHIDSENMFNFIYGEYVFKDSLGDYRINISPKGMYFAMKEYQNGALVEIYDSGIILGEVKDNKMYLYTDSTLLLSGEIYFCGNTILDVSTLARGYLLCKCIL